MYQFFGIIEEIKDYEQVTERFCKREFVVVSDGESKYPNPIKFQCTQERCDDLDGFSIGDEVRVDFYLSGRKWEKNGDTSYFINLDVQGIEKMFGKPQPAPAPKAEASVEKNTTTDYGTDSTEDIDTDLPF
jgi:hypothetical protein